MGCQIGLCLHQQQTLQTNKPQKAYSYDGYGVVQTPYTISRAGWFRVRAKGFRSGGWKPTSELCAEVFAWSSKGVTITIYSSVLQLQLCVNTTISRTAKQNRRCAHFTRVMHFVRSLHMMSEYIARVSRFVLTHSTWLVALAFYI